MLRARKLFSDTINIRLIGIRAHTNKIFFLMINARMSLDGGKQLRVLAAKTHSTITAHRVPTNGPASGTNRKSLAYMFTQIFDEKILNHQCTPLMKYWLK